MSFCGYHAVSCTYRIGGCVSYHLDIIHSNIQSFSAIYVAVFVAPGYMDHLQSVPVKGTAATYTII